MQKGDLVFYRQRVHEILLLDGPFLLIKDVTNATVKWVGKDLVQDLKRKKDDDKL